MRPLRAAPVLIVLARVLLAASPAPAAPVLPDVLPYDQVRAGMTGSGRTVMQGDRAEPFDVEILGKLDRIGPGQNLILARLASPALARTGVLEGMSGSPVWIDGKMIGAVAYSWGFAKEAIAGITPIEEMIAIPETVPPDTKRPEPRASLSGRGRWGPPEPGSGAVGTAEAAVLAGRFDTRSAAARLEGALASSLGGASPSSESVPLPLPVAIRGLSAGWLAARIGAQGTARVRLQGGGAATPAAGAPPAAVPPSGSARLVPGDAVGAQLVRGDVEFTAVGTVTRVDGDRVLAFGHPFLQLGPVEYPMTRARVETLLPSLQSSFKIAGPTEEVGSFLQDRASGLSGRLGGRVRMVPVRLEVRSESRPAKSYAFDVVSDPLLTPVLLFLTLGGVLEATEKVAGEASIELREGSVLLLDGGRKADLSDLYAGPESLLQASATVGLIAQVLLQNEYDPVRIEGVNLVVSYTGQKRLARITGAWTDRTQVHPGEKVELRIGMKPYREGEVIESVPIEIPKELPPGPLSLHVGDALTVTRVEQAGADGLVPLDLDALLEIINTLRKNRALGILGTREEPSILIGSDPFPNLPPSKSSVILRRDSRGNFPILRTRVILDESQTTDWVIVGYRKVDLEVVR